MALAGPATRSVLPCSGRCYATQERGKDGLISLGLSEDEKDPVAFKRDKTIKLSLIHLRAIAKEADKMCGDTYSTHFYIF